MMKALGQRYVQYVNLTYRRSGTLWEGRFRSCLTQEETYLLACQRYIELNPVRAGMVEHPAEYRWSSYRANAQGEADSLVQPHALYMALSEDLVSRQAAYRERGRRSCLLVGIAMHPVHKESKGPGPNYLYGISFSNLVLPGNRNNAEVCCSIYWY